MVFDGFQVARNIKAGQSHQFSSQIEANVQYASHAVRVEEWQQANVDFLVLVFKIKSNRFSNLTQAIEVAVIRGFT